MKDPEGDSRYGNRMKRKGQKPTRRHMIDRLNHIDAQILRRAKDISAHKGAAAPGCECHRYCSSDRWIDAHYADVRSRIVSDFKKYGYGVPSA
jgi:hypothetical protein